MPSPTPRMNHEIKQAWVEALRSGKYKQGKNYLRPSENTFCCLGVLCDIAIKNGIAEDWGPADLSNDNNYAISYLNQWESEYETEEGELPAPIEEWAGLSSSNPNVIINHMNEMASLAKLNDEHNYTFAQLADIIEAQL